MGWSFRIAQIGGIAIKVHITFFLILILGAVQWGGITGTVPKPQAGEDATDVAISFWDRLVTDHDLGKQVEAEQSRAR